MTQESFEPRLPDSTQAVYAISVAADLAASACRLCACTSGTV